MELRFNCFFIQKEKKAKKDDKEAALKSKRALMSTSIIKNKERSAQTQQLIKNIDKTLETLVTDVEFNLERFDEAPERSWKDLNANGGIVAKIEMEDTDQNPFVVGETALVIPEGGEEIEEEDGENYPKKLSKNGIFDNTVDSNVDSSISKLSKKKSAKSKGEIAASLMKKQRGSDASFQNQPKAVDEQFKGLSFEAAQVEIKKNSRYGFMYKVEDVKKQTPPPRSMPVPTFAENTKDVALPVKPVMKPMRRMSRAANKSSAILPPVQSGQITTTQDIYEGDEEYDEENEEEFETPISKKKQELNWPYRRKKSQIKKWQPLSIFALADTRPTKYPTNLQPLSMVPLNGEISAEMNCAVPLAVEFWIPE